MSDIEQLQLLLKHAAIGFAMAQLVGTFVVTWGARFAAATRWRFVQAFAVSFMLQFIVVLIAAGFGSVVYDHPDHPGVALCIALPLTIWAQTNMAHFTFQLMNPATPLARSCVFGLVYFATTLLLPVAAIEHFFG
ncbi:hypothetical protein [Dyella mobilis]|uniref:Uncharacterized protein n=1 Tax=Dyella mobilis TaxID=1849582 RepID=A0ABS2KF84_9GAMM|nr:hypothetical protein [Dyella mobilis]MBM7129535.1 hypothetical protein [Dyella mobilis]GLQ98202.1 hypothetical protein GCM10007863_26220 [Dyella mobilis]